MGTPCRVLKNDNVGRGVREGLERERERESKREEEKERERDEMSRME